MFTEIFNDSCAFAHSKTHLVQIKIDMKTYMKISLLRYRASNPLCWVGSPTIDTLTEPVGHIEKERSYGRLCMQRYWAQGAVSPIMLWHEDTTVNSTQGLNNMQHKYSKSIAILAVRQYVYGLQFLYMPTLFFVMTGLPSLTISSHVWFCNLDSNDYIICLLE